jgi:hypothetical protein
VYISLALGVPENIRYDDGVPCSNQGVAATFLCALAPISPSSYSHCGILLRGFPCDGLNNLPQMTDFTLMELVAVSRFLCPGNPFDL